MLECLLEQLSMTIKLYDLAGEDAALRFSPFCWRTKMALKHKGLPFETEVWRVSPSNHGWG